MNKWVTSTFGISLAGLFALIALHGKAAAEAIQAFALFGVNLLKDAPLGMVGFFLSVALAVAVQPFLRKWLPAMPCHWSREFVVETVALLVGFGVMFSQMPGLMGALLGLLAGLMAPYIHKGIAAVVGLVRSP